MKLLTSINDKIKELEDKATDFEWEGDIRKADILRESLKGYYLLREQGELYVPEF